jgi:nuclease-like protein
MEIFAASRAGRSAERHFRYLRGRWRRRMASTLALAGGTFLLAAMLVARFSPWQPTFTAGVLTGCALTFIIWGWDDPPEVIAKWRRGSQGEQATARALRALGPDWYVRHDVEGRFGNLDHIVVGSGGVFLLDSKNLSGRAEVDEGVLHVRFPLSPADDRDYTRLPRALFGAAAGLRERLKYELGWIVDVHPVVVLTGLYPQRRAEAGRLVYLAVDELVPWLNEQPRRVAPRDVAAIRPIVAALPAARDFARARREAE